jgi:hypothetical protein
LRLFLRAARSYDVAILDSLVRPPAACRTQPFAREREDASLVRFLFSPHCALLCSAQVRRTMDAQLGFDTLTPISSIHTRVAAWKVRDRYAPAARAAYALAKPQSCIAPDETLCVCVCDGAQNLTGKDIPLFIGDVWCAHAPQQHACGMCVYVCVRCVLNRFFFSLLLAPQRL